MNTSEFGQGASIDLKFDEASFNKYFSKYDVGEMIQRHPNLESSLLPESSQDNEAKEKNRNRTVKELFIPTYELQDDELIKELKNPVKELEKYGRKYYSNSINSFIYGEQKNHLITQVRFSVDPLFNHDPQTDPEPKKELWVVRNDARNEKFIYTCKTLYKIQLSPEKNTRVEETFEVPHSHLWKYFGVEYRNCDQSDIKMFASMLLDLMKLDTPTLNKGTKCSDPDGQEEKVFISIKKPQTVCNSRHIIEVKKQ